MVDFRGKSAGFTELIPSLSVNLIHQLKRFFIEFHFDFPHLEVYIHFDTFVNVENREIFLSFPWLFP